METNQDNKNKTTSPKKKAATSRRTVGGASKAYFQVLFDAEERQGEEVALRDLTKEEKVSWYGRVGQWFQLLCLTHIPVFGFFYMLVIAFLQKYTTTEKIICNGICPLSFVSAVACNHDLIYLLSCRS